MPEFTKSFLVSLPVVILVVEVALASPLSRWIQTLLLKGGKTVHLLQSKRISDHWKERVLLAYAFTIFQTSMLIFALSFALIFDFLLGMNMGASVFSQQYEQIVVFEHSGYVVSSFLAAIVYLFARSFSRHVRIF
jgi:hypothetical protein